MASSRTSEPGLLRIDFRQRRREGGRDDQEADGEERDPQEKGLEVARRRAGAVVWRSGDVKEQEWDARGQRHGRGGGEGRRDRRDRARDPAGVAVDGPRGPRGPAQRQRRRQHREGDRPAEAICERSREHARQGELESGDRGPEGELDRGDAADEEDKRVPARERQRLLGREVVGRRVPDRGVPGRGVLGGRSPPERYRYVVHHFCRQYRTASRMKVVTKTI